MTLRVAFAGTPEFAARILSSVLDSEHEVTGVFTQPDRRAGRGRKTATSPVKELALEAGVAVLQPPSMRSGVADAELEALRADVFVVAAYGQILPASTLSIPPRGAINVHASLLPRWRGAAPIQRAILAGDHQSGISIMQMDPGLDTGPVYGTWPCEIAPGDTSATLHDRLAEIGGKALLEVLGSLETGTAHAVSQSSEGITYATRLHKHEAEVDWQRPAAEIERRVRAFDPWPVAYTWIPLTPPRRLRIWSARTLERAEDSIPGTVLDAGREGIVVRAGAGALMLLDVQIDGGRRMTAAEFLNARPLVTGTRLGNGNAG